MNKEILSKFKSLFEQQRREISADHKVMDEALCMSRDEIMDDVDLTTSELATQMKMRLRNRETLFMKKVEEALGRITLGTFGECADCGDEIELKRLEARPTATLCVSCKEHTERLESSHIDGQRSKSLGAKADLVRQRSSMRLRLA